jgi:hypothetical protein
MLWLICSGAFAAVSDSAAPVSADAAPRVAITMAGTERAAKRLFFFGFMCVLTVFLEIFID